MFKIVQLLYNLHVTNLQMTLKQSEIKSSGHVMIQIVVVVLKRLQ